MTATTTKERPIIFSSPMVRAILDGRKTATRRVVKPQPSPGCRYEINGATNAALHLSGEWGHDPSEVVFVPPTPASKDHRLFCPYGQPGDRLWVRETWWQNGFWACDAWHGWAPTDVDNPDCGRRFDPPSPGYERHWRKRSPIHMPRWASRITLEITGLRVERVQDITNADALAEGLTVATLGNVGWSGPDAPDGAGYSYVRPFSLLWDHINGPRGYGWNVNPWVWVVEFKRLV